MTLAQCFLDNFTGAADTKLSAHTPDDGLGWGVTLTGAAVAGDELELDGSGSVRRQGSNTFATFNYPKKAADASWGADQEINVTVPTVANINTVYLFARVSSFVALGEFNGYRLNFGPTTFTLRKYTGTTTVAFVNSQSLILSNGSNVGLRIEGTAINVLHNNSSVYSTTDSSHSSGRPYLNITASDASAQITSLQGLDSGSGGGGGNGIASTCFMHRETPQRHARRLGFSGWRGAVELKRAA